MSSKYSTKQYISAWYCGRQMSEIWCKNIQAFLRYSNCCVGIFYFASYPVDVGIDGGVQVLCPHALIHNFNYEFNRHVSLMFSCSQ